MRRLCIIAALVPSLLVASAPAQADAASSQRHQMRGGLVRTHDAPPPGKRMHKAPRRLHKYTYGR